MQLRVTQLWLGAVAVLPLVWPPAAVAGGFSIVVGMINQSVVSQTLAEGVPQTFPGGLLVWSIATGLASWYLYCGLLACAIRVAPAQQTRVADLFLPLGLGVRAIVASLLVMIVSMLGLILFIVPGILLLLIWSMVVPLVLDGRAGVFDAFTLSATITKGSRGALFLAFLVPSILAMAPAWIAAGQGMQQPDLAVVSMSPGSALILNVISTAVAVFMTLLLGVAYRELTAHTER